MGKFPGVTYQPPQKFRCKCLQHTPAAYRITPVEFIETPTFTRQVLELLSDEEYRQLQNMLVADPGCGDLVKGGGGIRKVRHAVQGRGNMQVAIRSIGNSKGVVLPKPLLAQAGIGNDEAAEMEFEDGAIVLRKVACTCQVGWAQAAKELAAKGGDALVMSEFGNEADADLHW